jgi:hypothetical protein
MLRQSNRVEIQQILQEAAETKSAEALPLLIKCLGYNHDPDSYKLIAGQANFVTVISYMRRPYGDSAGDALFTEALATDKEWLRERIALAVKTNLSSAAIMRLKRKFHLQLNNSQNGIVFMQALENEYLLVKLACHSMTLEEIFCTLNDQGVLKAIYEDEAN